MTINKQITSNELLISLSGRLDSETAPKLDSSIKESANGITKITLDFKELEYISSAGLRVLLSTKKMINTINGKLIILNVNDVIKEVFELTGFDSILTIK